MPIVGGLDIHRKQITFDYLDTVTGEVRRGQIGPSGPGPSEVWIQRSLDEGTERVMRVENSVWSWPRTEAPSPLRAPRPLRPRHT